MMADCQPNCWVYRSFERGLWTVGFYTMDGIFCPESDHSTPAEAAARVHYLNGGNRNEAA